MRRLPTVLAATLVVVLAASCGGSSDQSQELIGVEWRWSAVREGPDEIGLFVVEDPESYLLTLRKDGSFTAKADCNALRGTYSLAGDEITLETGPTTRAACGKDSLSRKYVGLLRRVATYDIYEEDALALGLAEDAGHLYFYVSSN